GRVVAGRRGRHVRVVPDLLGHQPDTRGGVVDAGEQRTRGSDVAGGLVLLSPLGGEDRPDVPGALVARGPRRTRRRAAARHGGGQVAVAVPVAVVAQPARAGRGSPLDGRLHDV